MIASHNTESTGQQGKGTIHCNLVNGIARLTTLSSAYPLRLLTPRSIHPKHSAVYVLTYGGGLVSGDKIDLNVLVGAGCALSLLTQGSTKIFPKKPDAASPEVVQRMSVHVHTGALLALLPEPTTPFGLASYTQHQKFYLDPSGSLLLLDWYTSGRATRGENWQFDRYASINEVWITVDGVEQCLARDAWLLEDENDQMPYPGRKSYEERMGPYRCFANVLLVGPRLRALSEDVLGAFDKVLITASGSGGCAVGTTIQPLIWSASPLPPTIQNITGVVIRAAAVETDLMRTFLKKRLRYLELEIGENLFGKI